MKRMLLVIGLCILFFVPNIFAREVLRLATTTSTYETGILDYILGPFEQRNGVTVHIISMGTGKAIKLGENGDVDVVLVHARAAEDKFVSGGYGVNRHNVMYNDFVILGPENDPAGVSGFKDVKQALRMIYSVKHAFISRGDDSGTDKKEKYLWTKAGLYPQGSWYLETGQGMSATLRIADEKDAYVMVDRASYLFNKDKTRLKILVEGDNDLLNSYGVIAVNPRKHPHVNYLLSMVLIEWLTSTQCQQMINDYKVGGEQLFYAKAGE